VHTELNALVQLHTYRTEAATELAASEAAVPWQRIRSISVDCAIDSPTSTPAVNPRRDNSKKRACRRFVRGRC
jgi:hypothetical protein